ncbi:MAG: FecR domain-containing protein [Chitinophagaceae bacterium]
MDKSARLRFLFARYLQRQCSPSELEELISLLQSAKSDDELSEEMELLWEEVKKEKVHHPVDWDKMYSAVISSEEETDVLIHKATSRIRWPYFVIAAVFLGLVVIPTWWYFQRSTAKANKETTVAVQPKPVKENDRQTIHLPDGSTVVLNAGSKLNYPSAFSGNHRDVYLTGEGFFDIKHDPATPFFVHTGKLSVKVLGTSFNIKSYPHTDDIEVTVTRGKVQVLKENKVLGTLTASQQISFSNESESVVTKIVDTLPVIAWKPAEIYFNDISMEDVARQMEKRFNIKIDFANKTIKNCRVTATFTEDDLPDEILSVICAVSRSDYKVVNDVFIIDGKGCN